ncbi:DUF488 domain-containing protein [Methylophaga pinxianii]|uniref:DUF488 domain-containing protein n=1 Tax=Methylophaga pinxianii TaxID=2881052 RepID=UPI001CF0D970|nr:DUF488 domain-containing protein [Methylophaga pinxianii]MCB2425728.1 DUF488 domain-containing protein [Methylophaga pinxianii]UPH44615.1 DUF488 domain-containing protein [Methylophaga pinxianii]
MLPFYTIGHSTRSIEEFIQLLHAANVTLVVDIRSFPRSRTNPQFNEDTLPATLKHYQIDYLHLTELGGRRNKIKSISDDTNAFWQNQSFQNYADYALTTDFQTGLDMLLKLGQKQCCVLMCSEAVWWRCHRRIVADYLLAHGEQVFHLMNADQIKPAKLTKNAVVKDIFITYPAGDSKY